MSYPLIYVVSIMTTDSNHTIRFSACILLFLLAGVCAGFAITNPVDSVKTPDKQLMDDAKVQTVQQDIRMTIQNVDITRFPEVRLICEVISLDGSPLDSLAVKDLTVLESGKPKKVISVEKISVKERVPVDFVFVLDVTGTMQTSINGIRNNIEKFTQSLVNRGVDYRLGLVMYSDVVEKVYPLNEDVKQFLQWVTGLWASGGGDERENTLEALVEAGKMKFRPSANRVAVVITDAPYHQEGERGNGRTTYTTQTIIEYLKDKQLRAFCIAPLGLKEYMRISSETRGAVFDITQPFSKILDTYSSQLTNLYAVTYRSDQPAIPDSLNVGILDKYKRELVMKMIPVVEIGRKLIIENLLFATGSSTIADSVFELEVIREFLTNKPKVTIRVEGHTDSRGNKRSNQLLSQKRADAVKNYLIRKGIAGDRIQTEGFGDTRPIADNTTDFGRRLNRRTEVVIVGK